MIVARTLLALVLCAGALASAQAQSRLSSLPAAGTIRVEGAGSVETAPDRATVSAGVATEAADADAALAENNATTARLIQAARDFGVPADGIATSRFDVSPRYGNSSSQIIGYRVTNTLAITTEDLGRIGELLNDLIGAGANVIQSVQFSVSDQTGFRNEALGRAVVDARGRAEALADAAEVSLGSVVAIDTVGYGAFGPPGVDFSTRPGVAESVPIEIGPYRITARATVIFAINR